MTDKYLIRFLVVILIYCLCVNGIAGDDRGWSQHTVFFEFAGAGLLYSVNYEFYVTQSVGIRTGLGVFPPGLSFPMLLNFYKGKEKRLELGLGFSHLESFLFGDYDTANVILATMGYSFKRKPRGIIFRSCLHPAYIIEAKRGVVSIGLSIGYGF